jgi:DNA-binding FadR family transcriptional regulator
VAADPPDIQHNVDIQITSGAYKPDELIDSECQLSHQFQISRHTVRQAINKLIFKAFCTANRGKELSYNRKKLPRIEITFIPNEAYNWTRQSSM